MTAQKVALPTLESGDCMDQREFHRRYELRHDIRADLIGGVVYVSSSMRYDLHDEQASLVAALLGVYQSKHTAEVRVGNTATLILGQDDEVQPDGFLFFRDTATGGPRINDDHYLEGAPQLLVEVAASSLSRDLGIKKESYRRAGVREYLVWRTEQQGFDWFELQGADYVRREPGPDGVIESRLFPGLRVNVPALLEMRADIVLAELR